MKHLNIRSDQNESGLLALSIGQENWNKRRQRLIRCYRCKKLASTLQNGEVCKHKHISRNDNEKTTMQQIIHNIGRYSFADHRNNKVLLTCAHQQTSAYREICIRMDMIKHQSETLIFIDRGVSERVARREHLMTPIERIDALNIELANGSTVNANWHRSIYID